jgi:hypothetical protein
MIAQSESEGGGCRDGAKICDDIWSERRELEPLADAGAVGSMTATTTLCTKGASDIVLIR